MNKLRQIRASALTLVAIALLSHAGDAQAQDGGSKKLGHVVSVSRDSLQGVTSVAISRDGKFLYAAAWQAAAVNVFERDPDSGDLTHVQELTDAENLNGGTALRLSPDGRYAVVAAFRSRTAVIYKRDANSGKLTISHVAREGLQGVTGLTFAIDAAFSLDSKFVYVANAFYRTAANGDRIGCVTVFRITDQGELDFVEANEGRDGCFANVRGIATRPDGKTLIVASSTAGALVVLDRDAEKGVTSIRQIVKNNEDGARGLDGVMAVAVSPDGKFVYCSAGRFRGATAIGVHKFDDQGNLKPVQVVYNDRGELNGFDGGNEITVSPGGKNVYAVASKSGALASFARDNETGRLQFLETVPNEDGRLTAAAGVAVSPDGKTVNVAAEASQTVTVYRRDVP